MGERRSRERVGEIPEERRPGQRSQRVRLDERVVRLGLAPTRQRAQALVLAGRILVETGGQLRVGGKPGDLVPVDAPVRLVAPEPYVGRGGYKLAAALDAFAVDPRGRICLDVGAGTGGFTHVLLQRGAARVYALDVGRGQLAESLRRDPRVVVMEGVNARYLVPGHFPEPPSLAVVDVAFISLVLVLGPVAATLAPDGEVIALVKPQFEAGRGVARRGVIRDPAVHREVLTRVLAAAAARGLGCLGVIPSPILGGEGNREFLVHLRPGEPSRPDLAEAIANAVAAAWSGSPGSPVADRRGGEDGERRGGEDGERRGGADGERGGGADGEGTTRFPVPGEATAPPGEGPR
jgi:23S rRNA (cytidine1920-2'-O)/16S rRNA (cytidine1409-2'-O)-methyltransferase